MININIYDEEQGMNFEFLVKDAAHFYDTVYHIKNLLTELERMSQLASPKLDTAEITGGTND